MQLRYGLSARGSLVDRQVIWTTDQRVALSPRIVAQTEARTARKLNRKRWPAKRMRRFVSLADMRVPF